jgi:hypothetical protein
LTTRRLGIVRTARVGIAVVAVFALALTAAPVAQSQDNPPSGSAFGLAASIAALGIDVPPSPEVECPPDENALDTNINLEDVVTIDALEISCETDAEGVLTARALLTGLAIDTGLPGMPPASAEVLEAFCTADGDDLEGGVNIVNVMIGADQIPITGDPNQTVPLPNPLGLDINLVFNRQIEGDDELTVQALFLDAGALGSATVGSVTCRTGAFVEPPPTTEPPTTEPPTTEPPTTEPPTTEPPTTPPPATRPADIPRAAVPVVAQPTFTG